MRAAFRRAVFVGGYLYVGCCLVLCMLLAHATALLGWSQTRRQRIVGRAISEMARGFVNGLRRGGALELDLRGIETLRERRGVVIAANHPTFLDAIFLFSFAHPVFGIIKASIFRNPLLGPSVRAAGYVTTDRPHRLVQGCCRRLRAGDNLLVFPEGTRSADGPLRRFKPGFALVAAHAQAPVVTVHIESDNGRFLRKGSPIIDLGCPLPLRYRFHLGEEFACREGETTASFLARVETYFQSVHARPDDATLPSVS
jgi:1-acyl-sn-glycerol-3-phosphate acyltransferase